MSDKKRIPEEVLSEYQDLFDSYDLNKTGEIERKEMKTILKKLGKESTNEEIEQIWKSMNKIESDYTISFDDFIEFFTGISATIKNDLIFNNMMNNIFNPINIFEKRNEIKNNLSNKDIKEINKKDKYLLSYENPIIKLKNNILSLGIKGLFEFEKQFYNNDIRKTGKIDYNIFENICYNYSLNKEYIKKL